MPESSHSDNNDSNVSNRGLANKSLPSWEHIRPDLQVRSGRLIAGVLDYEDRMGHAFWLDSVEPNSKSELEADKLLSPPLLIMTSLEGTSQEVWPSSSPFQQIVLEEIGTDKKPVLLAVGMAGKTHWSGTIEGDGMTEAIAMDFAARVNMSPDFVGSTYLVDDAWELKSAATPESTNQSILLKHKSEGIELVLDSIGSNPISISGNQITITFQADFPATKRNQTLRWRYVLRNMVHTL